MWIRAVVSGRWNFLLFWEVCGLEKQGAGKGCWRQKERFITTRRGPRSVYYSFIWWRHNKQSIRQC